jgi:hypothetical protein
MSQCRTPAQFMPAQNSWHKRAPPQDSPVLLVFNKVNQVSRSVAKRAEVATTTHSSSWPRALNKH